MRLQGLGMTLADAITRQENTPASWNNPGALTAAPSAYCQTGKINGIVQFCTPQDGTAALDNQLNIYAGEGLTLQQMIAMYAPAPPPGNTNPLLVGNNPNAYTANVSSWTGISPSTPLSSVSQGSLYVGSDPSTTLGTTGTTDDSGTSSSDPSSGTDISSSLSNILSGNIDLSDPTTIVLLALGLGTVAFLASRS